MTECKFCGSDRVLRILEISKQLSSLFVCYDCGKITVIYERDVE